MSLELPGGEPAARPKPLPLRVLHCTEDAIVSLVLLAMIGLPLADMIARARFGSYVPNGPMLLQNCTLIVGMLGALIAAREGRMLALSTTQTFLKGKVRTAAAVLAAGVGAAVAVLLGLAGFLWMQSDWQPGLELFPGFKTWWVQALLPVGFVLIGVRQCLGAGPSWRVRAAAFAVAALVLLPLVPREATWLTERLHFGAFLDWLQRLVGVGTQATILLLVLLLATLLGAPVFATLGGAAVILFWRDGVAIATVAIDHWELVKNPVLPTIPLFTLAGYFLAEGGSAPRIVRLCEALVGWLRGGPAFVTALACAFFTTFTGASGVTILAVGGLMMPVLLKIGYAERQALGLVTGAGSLGMLFPPCLPLILYAIRAKLQVEHIFLAGILPGILLLALTAAWGAWIAPRTAAERPPFSLRELARSVWGAAWELLVPVVALGTLFSGYATMVEAAALTAGYALIVVMVIRRRLWKELPRVLAECGLMVGGVILILGVAMGFTQWLIDADAAVAAVDWVKQNIHSRWTFLLALNGLLLIVGCLMDVFSAIIVVVPLLLPMAQQFGIDPLHLGIIVLANLELGYLTPPIGLNLFLASYRFKKPLPEVYRASLPMIGVLAIGVLVITYWPWLTLALPRWLGR